MSWLEFTIEAVELGSVGVAIALLVDETTCRDSSSDSDSDVLILGLLGGLGVVRVGIIAAMDLRIVTTVQRLLFRGRGSTRSSYAGRSTSSLGRISVSGRIRIGKRKKRRRLVDGKPGVRCVVVISRLWDARILPLPYTREAIYVNVMAARILLVCPAIIVRRSFLG
jgi:hypothetical protein